MHIDEYIIREGIDETKIPPVAAAAKCTCFYLGRMFYLFLIRPSTQGVPWYKTVVIKNVIFRFQSQSVDGRCVDVSCSIT